MEPDVKIQFFTATILEWKHLLKPDKYKDIIIESMRFLTDAQRVQVLGFTIMPNHIHLLWKIMPPHKRANVQRDFLKFTAHQIIKDLENHHPQVLARFKVDAADRKYQVWERNPLSVDMLSKQMLEQKLDYLHHNPVQERWKLTDEAVNYKYSSMSFYEQADLRYGFIKHYAEHV